MLESSPYVVRQAQPELPQELVGAVHLRYSGSSGNDLSRRLGVANGFATRRRRIRAWADAIMAAKPNTTA